jgi:hypothetical protein
MKKKKKKNPILKGMWDMANPWHKLVIPLLKILLLCYEEKVQVERSVFAR